MDAIQQHRRDARVDRASVTNRATYREHIVARPRSSLDRVLGEAATSEHEIMAMRKAAYREREFITFTKDELARLSAFARAAIQSAAREIFER